MTFKKPIKKVFKLNKDIDKILALPLKNQLLTNSLKNGFTKINLSGNKIHTKMLIKNFMKYVSDGEFIFIQPITNSLIAYAQKRAIILFNLETNKHGQHLICENFEESISALHPIANGNFLVLVSRFIDDLGNEEDMLRKYDISFDNFQIMKEHKLAKGEIFYFNDLNVFIYSDNSIQVLNTNLEPVEHPVKIFRKHLSDNSFNISPTAKIYDLIIHPSYPFAIIDLEGKKILFNWEDPSRPSASYIQQLDNTDFLTLSPNHKWLLYWKSQGNKNQLEVLEIISGREKFLGDQLILGEFDEIPYDTKVTWMPQPLSYVLIDTSHEKLIQWTF